MSEKDAAWAARIVREHSASRPSDLDYACVAQQAQGISGQLVGAKQANIRERCQEANKRADTIAAGLSSLISVVMPPQVMAGSNGEAKPPVDSSLSSDMDDLCRTLARIEQQVSRLSAAIGG